MSADGHEETPDPATTPGQQSSGGISRRQALGSAVVGAAGVALGPLTSRERRRRRAAGGARPVRRLTCSWLVVVSLV